MRPQTPTMVTSSSRANPTAGQPAKPLKPILKGSKNAQPFDSYESEGEMLASKRIARSQYSIPNVAPPGSRLGKYAFDLPYLSSTIFPRSVQKTKPYLINYDSAYETARVRSTLAVASL